LNKRYYSRALGEEAYLELLFEVQEKIIEKEAKFRLIEEEMLGKLTGLSSAEKQKRFLEKSLQIINYKLGKRSISPELGAELKKEIQKALVGADQKMKKKNIIEDY
jgi:hypothetical protein